MKAGYFWMKAWPQHIGLAMTAPMKLPGTFAENQIDGETVIMQIDTGDFFSLAGSALAIWQLLDGTRDRDALIAELCADFGTDETTVAGDLDAFLASLKDAGLIANA